MPSTNIILLIALFSLSRTTIAAPLNDSPNVDEDLVIDENLVTDEDLEKRSAAPLNDSLSTDEDLVIDEDLEKRSVTSSNIIIIIIIYNL